MWHVIAQTFFTLAIEPLSNPATHFGPEFPISCSRGQCSLKAFIIENEIKIVMTKN